MDVVPVVLPVRQRQQDRTWRVQWQELFRPAIASRFISGFFQIFSIEQMTFAFGYIVRRIYQKVLEGVKRLSCFPRTNSA